MMLYVVSCFVALTVCSAAEQKRAFGGGGGGGNFPAAFKDSNLIDWNSIFTKRALAKRQFSQGSLSGLEPNNMMNWQEMYSKRGFGRGDMDFPETGRFVDWNDYFAKRGRVRRAADEEKRNPGFGQQNAKFGQPAFNSLNFHDWRDSFARNYRSFDRNSIPEFGDRGMVNWSDYFKRAAAAKIPEEKKDEQ